MFEYLSLKQNVEFFLTFYGRTYDSRAATKAFERYGIADAADTVAIQASRGMRRKAQLIAALQMRPRLLLADEALDGLDEPARESWWQDLRVLAKEGATIVHTHHEAAVLEQHSDRVLELAPTKDGACLSQRPSARGTLSERE